MSTSVIIPTVARPDMTLRLLSLLAQQTTPPDEIIIAEQGGNAWDLKDIPPTLRDSVTILPLEVKSLAYARCVAAEDAHGDILIFFDDDILLRPDYITCAIDYLSQNPSCLAVGGLYLDQTVTTRSPLTLTIGRMLWIYSKGQANRILLSGWGDYVRGEHARHPTNAQWLFGCNIAVRADALRRVPFESSMRAWSFLEDLFWGAEMTRTFGPCMTILPALSVVHAPSESTGAVSRTTVRMRIVHRTIFWRRYIWPHSHLSFIPFCLGMIANLILILRQARKPWVITEHLKTWSFLISHPSLEWNDANSFIFDQN